MFWVQRWETESNRDCSTVQKACCWKPLSIVENFKGHCCYQEEGDRNKFDSLCIFFHHRLKLTESWHRGFRGRLHVRMGLYLFAPMFGLLRSWFETLWREGGLTTITKYFLQVWELVQVSHSNMRIFMTFCSIIAANPSPRWKTRPQDLTGNKRRRPPHCK